MINLIARGCTQAMASTEDSAIRNIGLSLPLTAPPGKQYQWAPSALRVSLARRSLSRISAEHTPD